MQDATQDSATAQSSSAQDNAVSASPMRLKAQPDFLWEYTLPESLSVFRPPLYHQGTVLLNLMDVGLNTGSVQALDSQSKEILWSASVPNGFFYNVTPAMNVLYCLSDTFMDNGTADRRLHAYALADGKELWSQPCTSEGPLTVIGGRIFFTTATGWLTCVQADGSQAWSVDTGQQGTNPTAVLGFAGFLWSAMNGWLFGIDADGNNLQALWLGGQVYGPLTADSRYLFCTTGNKVLYAIDPLTMTVAWQWQATGNLSAPQAYCGELYLCSAEGLFYARDPLTGTLRWQQTVKPDPTLSSMFLEDGIAFLTSFAEEHTTLCAIDVTSQGAQVVNFDLGAKANSGGVESGVVYFNTAGEIATAGAVRITDQLHEFFCESELMADSYVAGPQGRQGSTPSFRTNVQLFDVNHNPRSLKSIRVTSSSPVTVTSQGVAHRITATEPLWLLTDAGGELSLVSQAEEISSPSLYLWGNFMDPAESIVIYPDYHTLNALSTTQAEDLRDAKTFDGKPLMPKTLTDTTGLAELLRNTVGGSSQAVQRTRELLIETWRSSSTVPASPYHGTATSRSASSYIAFPESTPGMVYQPQRTSADRTYVRGPIPNWKADFQPNAVHFSATGALDTSSEAAPPSDLGSYLSWDDFWNDVVKGLRTVVSVVVNTAEEVTHYITDELKNVYRVVVDSLEKAVSLVAGFLKTVIGDIEKAIEWLSFLFDWDAILETKTALKGIFAGNVQKLCDRAKAEGAGGAKEVQAIFTRLSNDIGQLLESGPNTSMNAQKVNKNPQAFFGHKGARSCTKSHWLMDKLKHHGGQGSDTASSAALGSIDFSALKQFFDTLRDLILANPALQALPKDFLAVIHDLSRCFSNPKAFADLALRDILKLLVNIAQAIILLLGDIIEAVLLSLGDLVGLLVSFLERPLEIPVISELWSVITHGDALTILDLCCLIAAVPTYFITKAIEAADGARPGINLTSNIGYMAVAIFYAFMDAMCDTFDMKKLPVLSAAYLALGLLQMGLSYPTDARASETGIFVLYALGAIPLLGTLGSIIPLTAPAVTFILPGALCMYGCAAFFLTLELSGETPKEFDTLGELENLFAAIPYVAKPIGGEGDATPNKIVLGVIDFACDCTVFGMVIAEDFTS